MMRTVDLPSAPKRPKKLYYFGRSALWLFLILLAWGIFLQVAPREVLDLEGAPAFIQLYVQVLAVVLPIISPLGVIAALGIMGQRNWARHLMVAVLVLGLIGIVVYGVRFIAAGWTAPASQFRNRDKDGVIIGGVGVVALYVLGMLWCIVHIRNNPFGTERQAD